MKNYLNKAMGVAVIFLVSLFALCIVLELMPSAGANVDKEAQHAEQSENIAALEGDLETLGIEYNYIQRLAQNKQTQIQAKELELQAAQEGLYLFELEYCSYKMEHPDLYSDEEKERCDRKLNESPMGNFL